MARKNAAQKRAKALKEAEKDKQQKTQSELLEKPLPLDIEELKKELREDEIENSSNDDSDDTDEDEYGELLTEDVENGLNDVLKAIKSGDQRLFDSSVNFFKNEEEKEENSNLTEKNEKSSKPIYLKDYHRANLLANENEEDNIEKPYVLQQKEDKDNLIKEIHNALGSDNDNNGSDNDDDDDDFLIKKEKKTEIEDNEKLPNIVSLPDPEKEGSEKFLEAFMDNHAWLPIKGKEVEIENEDDSDFDEAAEKFENAYNFRYEDPKSTEIVSYARSQATMRREKTNSRKRERLRQQEEAKHEKEEINDELKKKKQKKVNLVMDRIKEIKEAVGDEISDEKIMKVFGDSLMNDDFDDNQWDAKMSEIFNDEYYAEDDKGLEKPEWDDGLEDDFELDNEENEEEVEEISNDSKQSQKSKRKEEKYEQKKEKNKIKDVAERLVESKTLDLLDEVQEERGGDKTKSKSTFKYREVTPETFGLTYNEIFQANDSDLNDFIGLKKLAPYRPQDKAAKDKRRITKSKNLREWRKRTFGSEKGVLETDDLDIKIPSIVFDNGSGSSHNEGPKTKKRRSNNKSKSKPKYKGKK
ncbi:KRRI-Interacting protein 1 [Pichia californica]|uniref:KRRI-Interacting protein 1 n=1 Tax=Pichia californica TaxID=460514 RepID=A0A9P6WIV0_9ASCO|nr:KRRI-Interacting protein 1 [[Candida] californica]KAG0687969.1 KRRI-Interacting protein 1 [[Candida] californica]